MADTKPVPTSPGTTFEYIPVDRIIPGNSTPHNPMANNPLRDPVSPNPPAGR